MDHRKLAVYHVFDTDGSGEMDVDEVRVHAPLTPTGCYPDRGFLREWKNYYAGSLFFVFVF